MVIDHDHIERRRVAGNQGFRIQGKMPRSARSGPADGETLVITKNGKPVAEVTPHKPAKRSPFGVWKGRAEILGDIISPLDVEWEALK
jgi:hypothetical protein